MLSGVCVRVSLGEKKTNTHALTRPTGARVRVLIAACGNVRVLRFTQERRGVGIVDARNNGNMWVQKYACARAYGVSGMFRADAERQLDFRLKLCALSVCACV